ncbi:ATP-binding protein [Streptomyces sp. PTM05]|uniref:ATP-binding protein n=1 Tax=Streptantibioticus parmotrematis TaxID=2873249 RepID=A0ABS7QUS8_9ACTN|nr:ATP-binding protein [Streptantibioticus parmotrematis]MBY8886961.1 ATP-binding protein [Streptantibioticus parmotrematis]
MTNDKSAPRLVRRHVCEVLSDWGLDRFVDDVRLVASELVTNAVVHGHGPVLVTLDCDEALPGTQVWLEVRNSVSAGDRAEIPVPVSKPGGGLLPESGDDFATGGRGLQITSALVDRCGTQRTQRHVTVWCRFTSRS